MPRIRCLRSLLYGSVLGAILLVSRDQSASIDLAVFDLGHGPLKIYAARAIVSLIRSRAEMIELESEAAQQSAAPASIEAIHMASSGTR